MQSKTSYFNRAFILKNTKSLKILAVLYMIVLVFSFPVYYLSSTRWMLQNGYEKTSEIMLSIRSTMFGTYLPIHYVVLFIGCGICALCAFSYKFNKQSTLFYHALPASRTCLFVSRYLCGMGAFIVPLLVNLVIMTVISLLSPYLMWQDIWKVTGVFLLTGIFFYTFSVLCCMFTGNLIVAGILYYIFNFIAAFLTLIASPLLSYVVYGMSMDSKMVLVSFSPIVALVRKTGFARSDFSALRPLSFDGWYVLLTLTVAAVLMCAAAYFLYRTHKVETCGDTICVKFLEPVFKYGFAVCFAITFTMGMLVMQQMVNMVLLTIVFLLSGILGCMIAQMLLEKSVHVFHKGSYGWIIYTLCAAGVLLICHFGLFGYSTSQPELANIEKVDFIVDGMDASSSDSAVIEKAYHFQKQLIDQKDYSYLSEVLDVSSVVISYRLKDGTTVKRQYYIPYTDYLQDTEEEISNNPQKTEVIRFIKDFIKDPVIMQNMIFPGGIENVEQIRIATFPQNSSVENEEECVLENRDLSGKESPVRVLYQAIEKDLENQCDISVNCSITDETYANMITIRYKEVKENPADESVTLEQYIYLNKDCTNTLEALKKLNVFDKDHCLKTEEELSQEE